MSVVSFKIFRGISSHISCPALRARSNRDALALGGRQHPARGSARLHPVYHPCRSKNGCAPAQVGGAEGGKSERNAAHAERAAPGRRDLLRVRPLYVQHVCVTPPARRAFFSFLLME